MKSPARGKDYPSAVVQAGVGGAGEELCGKGPWGGRQLVECEPMVCLAVMKVNSIMDILGLGTGAQPVDGGK